MGTNRLPPDSRLTRLEGLPPSLASYCSHLRRLGRSERSLETYADCLKTFAVWLKSEDLHDPVKAAPSDLARFQVWLATEHRHRGNPLSVGRQATYAAVVRQLFRFLSNEKLVLGNPAARLRVPKVPRRLPRDVLTAEELTKILSQPDDTPLGMRDGAALRLLALSGPRTDELVNVDVDDVALSDRELVVRKGKGGKQRLTFFDRGTQSHLAQYLVRARPQIALPGERSLLVNNYGRRARADTLGRVVRRHATAAGISRRLSPLSMRRTFCTLLLSGGASLKVIAELAGHDDLNTTTRYTPVSSSELAKVYHLAHPRCLR